MPVSTLPIPAVAPGNVLTSTNWNAIVKDNLNKLLNQAHRKLTVAQFGALTGIEDGDEVYLEMDSTAGIEWHLVYRTAEPTYKWRCLGGPALIAEVLASETTASAVFVALTTPGPTVTLLKGGDYDVAIEFVCSNSSAGQDVRMSYDIGGTGAVDADAAYSNEPAAGSQVYASRTRRKTGLGAVALTPKYRVTAGTGTALNRSMRVLPIRITN